MIRKNKKAIKRSTLTGSKGLLSQPQAQASGCREVWLEAHLNEMQHGEGEALVTEAAVHHHLNERQERARQLSQSKHYLVGGQERSKSFFAG